MHGLAEHWSLDPTVTFLNHGSFGACPRAVQKAQSELRARLEAQPVRFMLERLEPELDAARNALAAFVGADPAGLVFVRNATEGVNTVLADFPLRAGDAVLTTSHAYGACKNALDRVASRAGAQVIVAEVPFPLRGPEEVLEAVERAWTKSVRLALLDHITSPTGLVFPIAELVKLLEGKGVACLVDGAHAPGMVPLAIEALGASYYTGNCHKWLCAPKGAALLWAREDRRKELHPLVTSHGRTAARPERSRLHLEFDWTGTDDPSAFLAVKTSIEVMAGLLPGGWPAIMERNRRLVLEARELLCRALEIEAPAPASMIGSLATLPLPDLASGPAALQRQLYAEHKIELPTWAWPRAPQRIFRVSAQLYNTIEHYEGLARALLTLLSKEARAAGQAPGGG